MASKQCPPRAEGWLRHKENAGEAHLSAADGVVAQTKAILASDRSGRSFIRRLRGIFLMSRPPLLTRKGVGFSNLAWICLSSCGVALWFSIVTFAHETLTTTVLFDREIVRILNKHCVMCHAQNGPSFPLETYEQTWLQGRKIRADVIARHMPPWPAIPGYGQFVNDNSLTLREMQFVVSWVEGLGPRNSGTVFTNVVDSSGKPRPAVRASADFGHWQVGKPDLTRQFDAATIEPGEGQQIKYSVIDFGLTAERRIRAVEYMPSDRRVVRAAFFTVQETGQWIGSWTPWYGFIELPEGTAFRLPPGSHIRAEFHYQTATQRAVERGTLGLFFANKPVPNTASDLVLEAKPDRGGNRFHAEVRLRGDTHALALRTEIASGVKSIEVSTRKLDGGTEVLLFAKDFAQDWPTPYIFKEPVLLRRGTLLTVTAYGGPAQLTMSRY